MNAIRYDVYRCIAQHAGRQEWLRLYSRSLPVIVLRTSPRWSLL